MYYFYIAKSSPKNSTEYVSNCPIWSVSLHRLRDGENKLVLEVTRPGFKDKSLFGYVHPNGD
jgi:hypothetical protein